LRSDPGTEVQPIAVFSAGRIAIDLLCPKCSYNLRTLEQTGLCPECGHAVEESISAYLDGPAEWLHTLGEAGSMLGTALIILSFVPIRPYTYG
jgi:hypothetical protein